MMKTHFPAALKRCFPRLKSGLPHTATSTIENGFVYLPEKAPSLAPYVHEMITFPMKVAASAETGRPPIWTFL